MVQELSGFDCAMYPRQSTYNMFSGYPQQGYANVTASDYAGFNVTDPGLQHQTSAGAGCWYPGTTTATGGRSASAGLEDWGAQYGVNIPVSGNQSPTGSYNYQGRAGLVNLHHGQSSDYGGSPNNVQSSLNSSMGLSNSPSPTGIPPYSQANTSSSNVNAIAQRQTSRQPYDWMKKQSYPLTPSTGKTRTKDKYRVVYTDHQRLELEKEFHYSRYITIRRKAELAQTLSLSERQVKIWFQNRRAKERKHNKKREESLKGSSTGDLSGLSQGGMVSPGTMNMQGQSQLTTGVATSQHSHLDSHAPGTPVTQQGHSGIAVPNLALSQSSQMPPIVISPRSQQQPNSGPQTHT